MNSISSEIVIRKHGDRIPKEEWIVAALGGVLVIASLGFLGYRSVTERLPPSFDFEVEKIEVMNNQQIATIAVFNRGGRPVAALTVRATGEPDHDRNITIDYVPANSSRRIALQLDDSLSATDFKFTVESFTEP